jgi:hypothetical protein
MTEPARYRITLPNGKVSNPHLEAKIKAAFNEGRIPADSTVEVDGTDVGIEEFCSPPRVSTFVPAGDPVPALDSVPPSRNKRRTTPWIPIAGVTVIFVVIPLVCWVVWGSSDNINATSTKEVENAVDTVEVIEPAVITGPPEHERVIHVDDFSDRATLFNYIRTTSQQLAESIATEVNTSRPATQMNVGDGNINNVTAKTKNGMVLMTMKNAEVSETMFMFSAKDLLVGEEIDPQKMDEVFVEFKTVFSVTHSGEATDLMLWMNQHSEEVFTPDTERQSGKLRFRCTDILGNYTWTIGRND